MPRKTHNIGQKFQRFSASPDASPWAQLVELAVPMTEAMGTIYHAVAELLAACIRCKCLAPGSRTLTFMVVPG